MVVTASPATPPQKTIQLRVLSGRATAGFVQVGQRLLRCALGRGGIRARKREGDGATPIGCWQVRRVLYRADHVRRPVAPVPTRAMRANDGWCDAPADANYNKPVRHPYPASAERLWRNDALYDVVMVLGYNDVPRSRGRGSAIFVHLARPGYAPTEGCIALNLRDLRQLVAALSPRTRIRVPG